MKETIQSGSTLRQSSQHTQGASVDQSSLPADVLCIPSTNDAIASTYGQVLGSEVSSLPVDESALYNNNTTETGTFRPQIRPDVILGPRLLSGNTSVHYIKDRCANTFYRIGAREYFLISRMDGNRSLQEIETAYEQAYRHHLTQQAWTNLFSLLGKRALLVHTADKRTLAMLKQHAATQQATKQQSRIALRNADHLVNTIVPWVRFAFQPVTVFIALLLTIAMETFFLLHAPAIFGALLPGILHQYLSIPLFLLLVPLFIGTHEFAHATACTFFGGSVQEIGLGWRFFLPYTYCKIDDIVLLPRRWQRVFTAFAGIYINLLMVTPFALLWWISPNGSLGQATSALVLVLINLLTLANCLPFAELDGYLMLKYAFNMVDLRADSYTAWRQLFKHRDFYRHPADQKNPNEQRLIDSLGWRRTIAIAYGLLSLLYPLALLAGVIFLLTRLLHI